MGSCGDNSEMETEDMREESKKRPLDDSAEGGISKKSNFGEGQHCNSKRILPLVKGLLFQMVNIT